MTGAGPMKTLPETVAGALGKGGISTEAAKLMPKESTSGAAAGCLLSNQKSPDKSEANSSESKMRRQRQDPRWSEPGLKPVNSCTVSSPNLYTLFVPTGAGFSVTCYGGTIAPVC